MLLSIIIPVYNLEKYLDRCLESICSQEYRSIEIILINDGSTDNSDLLCREWRKRDNRIIYINQDNGGVSSARNKGLSIAKGEYIGFIDGDDWVDSSMIVNMIKAAQEFSADVVMCGYRKVRDSSNSGSGENCTSSHGGVMTSHDAIAACLLGPRHKGGYMTSVWNKIFKKNSIIVDEEIINFDEGIVVGEDQIWLMKVLHNVKCVYAIPDCYYNYYIRNDSAIGVRNQSVKLDKHAKDAIKAQLVSRSLLQSWGVSEDLISLMNSKIFFHVSNIYGKCKNGMEVNEKKELNRLLKDTCSSFLKSKNYSLLTKGKVLFSVARLVTEK